MLRQPEPEAAGLAASAAKEQRAVSTGAAHLVLCAESGLQPWNGTGLIREPLSASVPLA